MAMTVLLPVIEFTESTLDATILSLLTSNVHVIGLLDQRSCFVSFVEVISAYISHSSVQPSSAVVGCFRLHPMNYWGICFIGSAVSFN